MADISKILLPSEDEYNVKDSVARSGLANKQDTLVSGTNIKTINNTSLLGSGNISIFSGSYNDLTNKPTTISGYSITDAYTKTEVDSAIAALPEPMLFKGSLGTGGTITSLPTASSSNEGYVYKVITDGTYASQSAKVGDTFISDGSAWVLIPSGDEPSGTVTSIATGEGLTGGPITSSGTISSLNSNWLNGSSTGSVRTSGSDSTIGQHSVAEGQLTAASGNYSHAEGKMTVASGNYSHAGGLGTIAAKNYQTAIGKYNIQDTEATEANQKALIIGNGTTNNARSNALTVDWNGDSEQSGRATTSDMTSSEINTFVNNLQTGSAQTEDMTSTELDNFLQALDLFGTRTICPYDIGDIYETTNSANPNTKWTDTTWNLVSEAGDYIVEEGTGGIWTYRKWASGVVDMWGVSTGSEAPYGDITYGYWYPHKRSITFPFSIKNVSASYNVYCGSGWAIPGSNFPYSHNDSSSGITSSDIYSLASNSGTISVTYKIVVHGLWKTRETPQTIYRWRRQS